MKEHDHSEDRAKEGSGQRNVSKVMYHEYVSDAKDGGIARYLTELGDRKVPCYMTEPADNDSKPMDESELRRFKETSAKQLASAGKDRDERLEVSCHCGACQLHIVPPSYNESSEGWYVPSDRNKYYARLCCCRSCRLTLGFTLQPWTYIPPSQILTVDDEPVLFGSKAKETVQIEQLKHYQSSDFVLRSFCKTCGATLFYQSFERPHIIDVSVGVLRSKFGNAMAEEWLEWDTGMVSKRDEAVDEELVETWLHN